MKNREENRKRALFLSHIEMFPVISGDKVRLSQQLGRLLQFYDVDTIEISHRQDALDAKAFIPEIGESKIFHIPFWRRCKNALKTLFDQSPEMVNHYHHKEVAEYIKSIIGRYDLIFCGSPAMADYVSRYGTGRKVLDMTDSLSMNYANAATSSGWLSGLYHKENARRMAKYERMWLDAFDRVAYISEVDRNYLGYKLEKSVIVGNSVTIPHESDCNAYAPSNHTMAFVGMMRYMPNVQAANYMAQSMMPEVLKKFPDALLSITGANPSPEIRSLAGNGIQVTGFVDSLLPVYRDCGVFVAPMLSGSGIQNKIIQAMAYGCCVVTTPIGAEGIGCGDDALVVVPPGKGFNDKVISLLEDDELRKRIGRNARAYIMATMSENSVCRQFESFILP